MKRSLSSPLLELAGRLRSDTALSASTGELFDLILDLAGFVALHEDAIRASGLLPEPDHFATYILGDAQKRAIRRVEHLLRGLSRQDLSRIEAMLFRLEQTHGAARATPANFRLLLDGAILGHVAFVYSRKYREVVGAVAVSLRHSQKLMLPRLLKRVDRVFERRPAYLWRLGPEFGTDSNISYLLERGDHFIARCLYHARARRLANSVLAWREFHDCWVGESCDTRQHDHRVRNLVIKSCSGRHWDYGLLLTSLQNVPWEEIVRTYRNRSCKGSITISSAMSFTEKATVKLAASLLIFAILTFRNLDTWAATQLGSTTETHIPQEPRKKLEEIRSPEVPTLLRHMKDTIRYLQELVGDDLKNVTPRKDLICYELGVGKEARIPALRDGQVIHVDRERSSLTVNHGGGFSATYDKMRPLVAVGAQITRGKTIGEADDGKLLIRTKIHEDSVEREREPAIAELLSEKENYTMDPLSLLCCGEPSFARKWRTKFLGIRVPDLLNSDVYLIRNEEEFRVPLVFPMPGVGLPEDDDSVRLAEVFDDEVVVDVLGEEIS